MMVCVAFQRWRWHRLCIARDSRFYEELLWLEWLKSIFDSS